MGILSVRLDQELEEKLHFLMKQRKIVDKSAYIRQLLAHSIGHHLMDYLVSQVREKHMSAWRAAQIGGFSLREMLDELGRQQVVTYDDQALEEDLKFVLGD